MTRRRGGWKLIIQPMLTVLLALIPLAAHSTTFDDGNDRKLVKDLRKKAPAALTPEEKAILAASAKYGHIGGLCGVGGNAFLIRFRGRDAVVTSAHMLLGVNRERRVISKCDPSPIALTYMPNASYYDKQTPDRNSGFVTRKVGLLFPPVNLESVENGFEYEEDFAIFYLTEQISADRMPDGSERGALDFGTFPIEGDKLFMIGLAKDISQGMETLYQKDCVMFEQAGRFYHGCDTLNGSSGSLLATYENGELRFRGLHTTGTEDVNQPAKDIKVIPNTGTSSDHIRRFMEAQMSTPNPTFVAYDIQWALHRTGCYSGKLDNQWGAGSRKALTAFATAAGVTLSGAEPSAELLAAVEKAAPEGRKVCRP